MNKNYVADIFGMILLAVTLVLVPLNLLGGVISGIWLLILGGWDVVITGLLLSFGGPFFLSLPLMLSLVFVTPAVALNEKGKTWLATPFILLAGATTYAVVIGWCVGIFYYFIDFKNSVNAIPLYIWIYGVATGPWTYMAHKEAQSGANNQSSVTAFLAQVGVIISLFGHAFFDFELVDIVVTNICVQSLGVILVLFEEMERRSIQKRYGVGE